ncbi:MAG TPA: universal stress protein [Pseudonocardiaceae bacterium]
MLEGARGRSRFEIGKDGLSTIVVGVDDSPSSIHAAVWAAGLARREQATLVMVFVETMGSPAYWSPTGAAAVAESVAEHVDDLRTRAESYLSEYHINWDLVHGRGEPAAVLEAVAKEHRADCIVVGRSRRNGGLLGSVPKTLLSKSARPVIVIP